MEPLDLDDSLHDQVEKVSIQQIANNTADIRNALICIEKELNQKKCNPYEYHLEEEIDYRLFINNLIEKCLDQVHLGMEESEILLQLAEYLVILTMEKSRFTTKLDYLRVENDWLKETVNENKERCLSLDENVTINELMIQHYSKLHQLRTNQAIMVQKVIVVDTERMDIGLDIPRHMKAIFKLIINYVSQGRYEVAVSLINHSLQEMRDKKKTNTYDYAIMLHINSIVLRDMGSLKDATTLMEETLRVLQQLPVRNNEHIVTTLNNLSVLYGRRGNFKAAEPLCRKALQIRLNELGPNHADVAKQLNNLALILQNIKPSPEIEQLYIQAIDIYNSSLEKCLIHKVKTKNNLACFYIKFNDLPKAEKCLKEIIVELHANESTLGRTKRCIWEITEECVENKVSKQHYTNLFPKIGTYTDASYKNTFRYLTTVYRRTQRLKEADMLEEYMEWCNFINSQQKASIDAATTAADNIGAGARGGALPDDINTGAIAGLSFDIPVSGPAHVKHTEQPVQEAKKFDTRSESETQSDKQKKKPNEPEIAKPTEKPEIPEKSPKTISSKLQKGLNLMFKK